MDKKISKEKAAKLAKRCIDLAKKYNLPVDKKK